MKCGDDGLKKYLIECGATPLDASVLENYARAMAEVIPQIVRDIEQRERLAAELRVLSPAVSRSKKERD